MPVIGLGTARTFDVSAERDIAVRRQIIERCIAAVTFVDSSPMYGQSERVIGLTTEGCRDRFQVATKVWCHGRAHEAQIDNSFRLLKTTISMSCRSIIWSIGRRIGDRLDGCGSGRIGLIGITHYSTSAYPMMLDIMR